MATLNPGYSRSSLQCAGQLLVKPPHRHIVLRIVPLQLFILRPLYRSDGLLLRGAAVDLLLDAVADINQHLTKAGKALLGLLGDRRNGTMRRYEDFGTERLDRIKRLQPVEAITVVDPKKLVGEKEFAQIGDA